MEIIKSSEDEKTICDATYIKDRVNSNEKNYFNKVNIKPWGKEYLAYQSKKIGIWILYVNKNQETSLHCHFKKDSLLIALSGCFKINLFKEFRIIHALDNLYIPRDTFHGIHAYSDDSILLEIELYTEQISYTDKNDLLRLRDIYIRDNCNYETSITESNVENNENMNFHINNKYILNQTEINIVDMKNNMNDLLSINKNMIVLLEGNLFINGTNICEGSLVDLNEFNKNNYSILSSSIKLLSLYNLNYKFINKLIYSNNHLKDILLIDKISNIGLTSGCFDIMHFGHLKTLKISKELCNKLFVCLSSDTQIKRLKGNDRPINNIIDRIHNLIYCSFIDKLILYEETDDLNEVELNNIMNIVNPSTWFKGSDYIKDEILKKHPGLKNIKLIDLIDNISTTSIIYKIKMT
jgi:rfaE bifunctional protein nucleotidyltransferase chain/domain